VCPHRSATPEPAGNDPAARLRANLQALRTRIARAAERAGRDPAGVRLVAVTKGVSAATAALLAGLGVLDLGESRVQELERKAAFLAGAGQPAHAPRWHLIGHLQRNKVRRALAHAGWLHSLDSLRLLAALEEAAAALGVRPRVYFEVRLAPGAAGSAERTGFEPRELAEVLERARDLGHVRPVGLMTMGPAPDRAPGDALAEQAASRAVFAELAALREHWRDRAAEVFEGGAIQLSMGMSSDLEAAVAEHSDVVRVGTALFEGVELAHGRTGPGEARA
jgi:pyridoxal phosphate enzyme (YggS family)